MVALEYIEAVNAVEDKITGGILLSITVKTSMGEVVTVGEGMTIGLKRVEVDVKNVIEMHNYLMSVYDQGDARSVLISVDLKENLKPWTWRYENSLVPVRLTAYVYLFGVAGLPDPAMGAIDANTYMIQKLYQSTELKQIEADDQAIQTILLGLPKDIYAAVDSCETAQKIWLRVKQMMKGSDIRIQDKKAKLFNEWERFTSNDEESTESYYHRFLKFMNDLKRNKHFPEKIASNLKF
nr:ribonuclease H-like domain-containing protein [Tanacetum cinerariifolium]